MVLDCTNNIIYWVVCMFIFPKIGFLRMKILHNIKQKKLAKVRAQAHIFYRKQYEDKLIQNKLIFDKEFIALKKQMEENQENYKVKINEMSNEFKREIDDLHFFYKKELDIIREQEKIKWLAIIHEREVEITKLQQHIDNNRELYNSLRERETELEAITKIIAVKFSAGNKMITKGIQSIEMAIHTEIETYMKKYLKNDIKILEIFKDGN